MPDLLFDEQDHLLQITLNRPSAHNAISNAMAEELYVELERAGRRRDLRAIIFTGAGERAFCAGADLKERREMSPDEKWAQRTRLWRINLLIWHLPQPAIAAIHGWCLGGGFELALACDFRIATEQSTFSFPEMSLGAYPGAGGPIFLPRLIGRARAKEILFTARQVPAAEALDLGIVEWLVPREDLAPRARQLAEGFKRCSPLGIAGAKRLINQGSDLPIEVANDLNEAIRRPLEATKDYEEGIRAHYEKRQPVFRGE
ncbi:MAG: enoyl-CoA hydratase-related protein [Candidatus Methylomirabilota bacterium]